VFGNLVDHFSNDKERYPDRKSKCGNSILASESRRGLGGGKTFDSTPHFNAGELYLFFVFAKIPTAAEYKVTAPNCPIFCRIYSKGCISILADPE
jgi:hypothetical protein